MDSFPTGDRPLTAAGLVINRLKASPNLRSLASFR
jgi:hypothetical protein